MSKLDKKSDRYQSSADESSSFVSRWSRRKRGVVEDQQSKSVAESESNIIDTQDPCKVVPMNSIVPDGISGRMQTRTEADRLSEICARTDEEGGNDPRPLTDAEMPSLDSLDESSDYSAFMSSGVSEKLRKLALRKLFSGAAFNVRDGLDDYDEDFTNFEGLGDIVTCDMKHRSELEEEKRRQAEQLASETEPDGLAELESEPIDSESNAEPVGDSVLEQNDINQENIDKDQQEQSVATLESDSDDAAKSDCKKPS